MCLSARCTGFREADCGVDPRKRVIHHVFTVNPQGENDDNEPTHFRPTLTRSQAHQLDHIRRPT